MSTLNVKLPESIRSRVEHFAREDGVSVDEFVATVLSQRVAVAKADSYIRNRAAKGSSETLIALLDKAPDVEPEAFDLFEAVNTGCEELQRGEGTIITRESEFLDLARGKQ